MSPTPSSCDVRLSAAAPAPRATPTARVVAVLAAAWCLGFAAVNVAFEATDRFADGPYADKAALLSAMDWLVVLLKVLGAAVALLSVTRRPSLPPRVLGALVWGAFATPALYALGAVIEGLGMLVGLVDGADRVDGAALAYVAAFVAVAVAFGFLAVSYSRRHRLGRGPVLAGVVIAPLLLAAVFGVAPSVLSVLL